MPSLLPLHGHAGKEAAGRSLYCIRHDSYQSSARSSPVVKDVLYSPAMTLDTSFHVACGCAGMGTQTSTSLQHVPLDISLETHLSLTVLQRLAFARQKLDEIVAIARNPAHSEATIDLAAYTGAPKATSATASLPPEAFHRSEPYSLRRPQQPQFPPFPTTTIGSFPQIPAIRRARLQYKKGALSQEQHKEQMAAEIGFAIGMQEALGLDVLVHG